MTVLLASGLLPRAQRVSIELDPGEPYFLTGEPAAIAQQVNDALDEAGSTCPRLTHGMNDWTWPLVADAFRRGHDTRVGFEDSIHRPDGRSRRTTPRWSGPPKPCGADRSIGFLSVRSFCPFERLFPLTGLGGDREPGAGRAPAVDSQRAQRYRRE